jgi:hypothetical protein
MTAQTMGIHSEKIVMMYSGTTGHPEFDSTEEDWTTYVESMRHGCHCIFDILRMRTRR